MENNHVATRLGEVWTIGTYAGLVFRGVGRDFEQTKYLVFDDMRYDRMFIIDKDEFYSAELYKHKSGD